MKYGEKEGKGRREREEKELEIKEKLEGGKKSVPEMLDQLM